MNNQTPNWQLEAEIQARANQALTQEIAQTHQEKAVLNAKNDMLTELNQNLQKQMNILQEQLSQATKESYKHHEPLRVLQNQIQQFCGYFQIDYFPSEPIDIDHCMAMLYNARDTLSERLSATK